MGYDSDMTTEESEPPASEPPESEQPAQGGQPTSADKRPEPSEEDDKRPEPSEEDREAMAEGYIPDSQLPEDLRPDDNPLAANPDESTEGDDHGDGRPDEPTG